MNDKLILLIHCPDREGLVASVTSVIRRFHGNVVDLDQHVDAERGVFFMRVAWTPPSPDPEVVVRFERAFVSEVAVPCAMHWRLEHGVPELESDLLRLLDGEKEGTSSYQMTP